MMRHTSMIPACTALLTALTGCVDQANEVAAYRRVLDAGPAAPAPAAPPPVLTLAQALAMANAHNERLAISGENYLQALIEKDRAVWSFLPTAGLSAAYLRQEKAPAPPGSPSFTPSPAADVSVSEGVNLFHGFRDVAALQRAAAGAEERKAMLRELQGTVLVETAGVYYQVLRTQKLAEVLAHSVAVQVSRATDLDNKRKAGTARSVDVSQAHAQAAATRVALRQSQADTVRGRAVLAFLVGAHAVESRLVDGFDVPAVPPRAEMERQGQAHRQDIVAAAAASEAAQRNLEAAVGQYYPSVTLNLTQFLHRETFPSESRWNSLLSVNVPIFSAGQIHSDVRAAWSRLRQAGLRESMVRRQVLEEVRIAHENLLAGRQTLEELRTQQQAAEAGFRQATEAANAGVATELERLISQDQLLSAQVQVVTQEYAIKVAYLVLLRAAGRLALTDWPLNPCAPRPAAAASRPGR